MNHQIDRVTSRRRAAIAGAAIAVGLAAAFSVATPAQTRGAILYRLSFPQPQHHWMQVEVTFPDLPPGPLRVRMSRSSPGRYALHEFVKNVYGVEISDGTGKPLQAERPDLHGWDVAGHDGTVRVAYRIFGDLVDGTYLGIDSTHAHINMPAALMWAKGLEDRPARVEFVRPSGTSWKVATQLMPTGDPLVFEAPNHAYLMDSPAEFSDFTLVSFRARAGGSSSSQALFRVAAHHEGSDQDVREFADDLQKLVQAAVDVFGEFPEFEGGAFTFLTDTVPRAHSDGMEHRNSTVLTSPGSIDGTGLIGTAAHEICHAWNVERIRPASLEPFDFERANVSGELWLGEGFCSYYENLFLYRAGLTSLDTLVSSLNSTLETVINSPARRLRSAVDMSRLAPFVDDASWVDPTDWPNTFLSYYTFGAAIGLGLDLSLRDLSDNRVTLDTYMRALWVSHGKPDGGTPGRVARPYTLADARRQLAAVAGDAAFADRFFDCCIEGREVADYTRLLGRAGLLLRPRDPDRVWIGDTTFDFTTDGARLSSRPLAGSPLYEAGLDRGDVITMLDGIAPTSQVVLESILGRHRAGDRLSLTLTRGGERSTSSLVLGADPHVEIVPVERTGKPLGTREREFRLTWLNR